MQTETNQEDDQATFHGLPTFSTENIDFNALYGQEVCRAINALSQALRDRNQTLTAFEIDGTRTEMLHIPENRLTRV